VPGGEFRQTGEGDKTMPRMLDLIRNSEVPPHLMQSAARGSLSLPAGETIEILVYLALHNKIFSQQARLTLAGWDEKACLAAAQDPATSADVLGYWVALENLRIPLLPALVENSSVEERSLSELATQGARPVVDVLLASQRAKNSPGLLKALQSNPNLRPNELTEMESKLEAFQTIAPSAPGAEEHAPDEVVEGVLTQYLTDNAAELEKEKDKPFQPIGAIREIGTELPAEGVPAEPTASASVLEAKHAHDKAAAAAALAKKHAPATPDRRDSTLQKIAKLDVKGRIALAVRGSKEERSILIRDGTKLVALAVLDSPKVTDGEVEAFALQKNVLETVLRAIPLKRRFAKNYSIMRNLVFNPRTPIDLALGLVKNLLVHDLKNLSGNKEVSETIRKVALRMFKQKVEKRG